MGKLTKFHLFGRRDSVQYRIRKHEHNGTGTEYAYDYDA